VSGSFHGEVLKALEERGLTMNVRLIVALALVPMSALAAPSSQVQALRQEVAALQLDHTLNLSQQQAQALLPILQDASTQLAAMKAQRSAAEPAVVAALSQAVADLKANGAISDATITALKTARGGSTGTYRQAMVAFWKQARAVLTADQVQALRSAKPGLRQPAQAADAGGGRAHRVRRPMGRLPITRTLLSDSFIPLVQARAG
jgi:hypothetical protein